MARSSASYKPGHVVPVDVQRKASNRGWEVTRARYGNPALAPGAVEKAKISNAEHYKRLSSEENKMLRLERRKVHDAAIDARVLELTKSGAKLLFVDRRGEIRPDIIYLSEKKLVAEDIKTGRYARISVDWEVAVQ